MMRGRVLSDNLVIEKINAAFVPVTINVTDDGFPRNAPGLEPWRDAYDASWISKIGFATSMVLSPNGRFPLGHSGSGFKWEFETSKNYHVELYTPFLDQSLERCRLEKAIREAALPAAEREKLLIALLAAAFETSTDRVEKYLRKLPPGILRE